MVLDLYKRYNIILEIVSISSPDLYKIQSLLFQVTWDRLVLINMMLKKENGINNKTSKKKKRKKFKKYKLNNNLIQT